MVAKGKAKSKIGIKHSNQIRNKLIKHGKLKRKQNKPKISNKRKGVPLQTANLNGVVSQEESNDEQDVLDMIEDDDMNFLKQAVSQRAYTFMKQIPSQIEDEKFSLRKKRKSADDIDTIETNYEEYVSTAPVKKTKPLLPIKTSLGLVERTVEIEDEQEEPDNENGKEEPLEGGKKELGTELESDSDLENDKNVEKSEKTWLQNEVTTADMFASREEALQRKKFHIGLLCTGLLENPETKLKNFTVLLNMMDDRDPETFITSKKLVCVSLLEVFKDLLPSYQIKLHDNPNVKLKKSVRQLHDFESSILKAYKTYLQKLDKIVSILRKKKGDHRIFTEPQLKLAEIALKCLCELLTTHPYFNFSKNIIHLIVPYLNHKKETVRSSVAASIKTVFKDDKRGEKSLEVVRSINQFVKNKSNNLHREVLEVLLALKIKDVNLDAEKEEEIKEKKIKARKQKIIKTSKREKRRRKRLEALEQELLETKAEENKKAKQKCLTEITKIVFMIYFRILKRHPNSKLLSVTLEGLAKFAHCINLEFYHDLVYVLDQLIEQSNLGFREYNHCVQTVFIILSGQGEVLNIDPRRFYTHLYKNMLQIHAGRNHSDLPVLLKTLELGLIKRNRRISLQTLLAFIKRLAILSMQLLPNGTLACLALIRNALQSNKAADILLDPDNATGQGKYMPEVDDPEYSNAAASSLWELIRLKEHYHPAVRSLATYIVSGNSASGKELYDPEILKKSPCQLFFEYDSSDVKFNPPVVTPKEVSSKFRPQNNKTNKKQRNGFREKVNR